MRIVAGRFRGAALAAPRNYDIRPTSDRVREAVFNILAHGIEGGEVEGARVLDLFAGTGALGLEALSRGAAYVHFVEESAEARGLIRRNIEALSATGVTQNLPARRRQSRRCRDFAALRPGLRRSALRQGAGGKGARIGRRRRLAACPARWRSWRSARGRRSPRRPDFGLLDERIYGDTAVRFLRFTP